eukprot:CAMPEP_0172175146 /NCGR_PEP_ID=MMETSP1050-20130122/14055_1 /TAXON_ID=233186 /ORGANISM="Cryptomonas curvata, Strain CCAP979/52" /LENGTH=100 /DNA_ID=CAMNT_0012847195 /DNA_START=206 /DNA_END=505 /DNA_ORIENTATION=+
MSKSVAKSISEGEDMDNPDVGGGTTLEGVGNPKLFSADIRRDLLGPALPALNVHAGTWLRHVPLEVPNLDIPPAGYTRQWIGEERMGGGWSSDSYPLSVD